MSDFDCGYIHDDGHACLLPGIVHMTLWHPYEPQRTPRDPADVIASHRTPEEKTA